MDILNGTDTIQWVLLDVYEPWDAELYITKDCVAQMPYDELELGGGIVWGKCTLRKWLNEEFVKQLPPDIQSRIYEADIQNVEGNNTPDKVHLLNIEEANKYFYDNQSRSAYYKEKTTIWWLRSPGLLAASAAYVNHMGMVTDYGNSVLLDGGVRPALWLKR